MADRHNKAMSDYYASNHPNLEFAPSLESVKASIISWPHSSRNEHAKELAEFDAAAWGWDVANNRPTKTEEPQHG